MKFSTPGASKILALLVCLALTSEVFANRGRPVPPARSRPPVERTISPLEKPIRSEDLFTRLTRDSDDTRSLWERSESYRSWRSITDSLGAPTKDLSKTYVAIFIGDDGMAHITSNFDNDRPGDAKIFRIRHDELSNEAKLSEVLNKVVADTPGSTVDLTLKVIMSESLDSPKMNQFFDREQQTFRFNSTRFRFAELFSKASDRVFSLERVDRQDGPPRWVARLNKCCVYSGIPPDFGNWSNLKSVPFDKTGIQIVSLFPDRQTTAILKEAGLPLTLDHPSNLQADPIAVLREAFGKGKQDSPVVVIGHVEGGSFKVEMANGFEVKLEAVVQMAQEAGRPVVLLGCYTAEHYKSFAGKIAGRDYPIGTLSTLHPREVAPRLSEAVYNAKDMQEFMALLSNENLYVWVSNNFLRDVTGGKTIRAPIFSETGGGSRSITGFIFSYLPCRLFGACS